MVLDNLLSSIKLGDLEIPNRVAMAPMGMGEPLYSSDETWPKRVIRYYEERAIGGTGLIITGFCRVHEKLACVPIVGICVATVHKLQSVPLQNEADGPIEPVNGRDTANDHAVFFIDNFVDSVERKLVNLELPSPKVDHTGTSFDVPLVHFLHFLHAVLCAEFRY